MNVSFVLCASGHVTMPMVRAIMLADTEESAKVEAQATVAQLYKAGYFSFWLYDTRRTSGDGDLAVASFRVAEQEPHILMN